MTPAGSQRSLTARSSSSPRSPISSRRYGAWSRPTAWWCVIVPPAATIARVAASEAILSAGGTITHHHAVGRDHRSWYDRQRPEPFAEALRAAKSAVDPGGILNPGVLIDP